MEALIKVPETIRDRAKAIAKQQNCTLKTLTTHIMDQALARFEQGNIKLIVESVTMTKTTEQGKDGK